MKNQFIKIQEKRYRLSVIKMYEANDYPKMTGPYRIRIMFSVTNSSLCRTHAFSSKKERDKILSNLDDCFNTML